MIGILTNTSLMVLTNSLFDFLRETYAGDAAVASLGAFVVWERVMVSIKYGMQFFTSDKSPELVEKLKDEKRKKDDKLREEVQKRKSSNDFGKSSNSISSGVTSNSPLEMDEGTEPRYPDLSAASTNEYGPLLDQCIRSDGFGEESSARKTTSKPKFELKRLPKRSTNASGSSTRKRGPAVNARSTANSPFGQYVQNEVFSPHMDSRSINDDGSLGEMLSLDSRAVSNDDSFNEFRTPLKPSMQRSMNVRNRMGEIEAADERIRNRLKSVQKVRRRRHGD